MPSANDCADRTVEAAAPPRVGRGQQRQPAEALSLGRNFRLANEGKVVLNVRAEFQNVFNRLFLAPPSVGGPTNVSPASYWEIAIKIRLGKYSLPERYEVFIEREIANNDFRILPIIPKHTAALTTMPLHHRDPFDRLMIAQARRNGLDIVGADASFDAYGVTRLW